MVEYHHIEACWGNVLVVTEIRHYGIIFTIGTKARCATRMNVVVLRYYTNVWTNYDCIVNMIMGVVLCDIA